MVTLPDGWNTFDGGGSDPELCQEDNIPPIVITPSTPVVVLDCTNSVKSIPLEFSGGVAPFVYTTSEGFIEEVDLRNLILHIDNNVSLGGRVPVGVQLFNPCSLPAYVYRSRTASKTGGACQYEEFCDVHQYNCRDEFIGGLNIGISFNCNPAEEEAAIHLPFDPDTDLSDYTECIGVADLDKYPYTCFNLGAGAGLCSNPFPGHACPDPAPDLLATVYPEHGFCSDTPTLTDLGQSPHVVEGAICDTRHPNLKALGCSPCSLIAGQDILVDITDAVGNNSVFIVHVNP